MEYLIAIGVAVMIYILIPKRDDDKWDGSDIEGSRKYIKKIVPEKKAVKKRTRKSTARDKTKKKKVTTTKRKTKRKTKKK